MNRPRSSWSDALRAAGSGVALAIREERHMKVHVAAAVAVAAAGLWLRVGRYDWLWLGAAVAMVWSAEIVNTAVERIVDLASPQRHPLAKAAKDAAAGAVLVASAFAAVVGVTVLGPPLWRILAG